MQNLHETYLNLHNEKTETQNLITTILENTGIFDQEDSNFIVETIIKEGLIDVFVEDTLEFYNMLEVIDESTIPVNSRFNILESLSNIELDEEYLEEISKGLLKWALNKAGGRLKRVPDNLKGLSAKTLLKKGYSVPGQAKVTGVRDTPNRNVSARSTLDSPKGRSVSSVRTPREKAKQGAEGIGRRRGETIGDSGKYLKMLRDKKANASSSASSSAIVPTKSAIQRGWERHDAATSAAGKGALTTALIAGLMSGIVPAGKLAATAVKKVAPNTVSSSGISNVLRARRAALPNPKSAEKGGAIVPVTNASRSTAITPSSQADDARTWQRYQDSARSVIARTGGSTASTPQGPGAAPKPQWGADAAKSTGPSKRPRMANRGAASEPSPSALGAVGMPRGQGASNTQTGGSASPRGNVTAASVRRARAQAKADAAARGQGPSGSAIPMGGSGSAGTKGSNRRKIAGLAAAGVGAGLLGAALLGGDEKKKQGRSTPTPGTKLGEMEPTPKSEPRSNVPSRRSATTPDSSISRESIAKEFDKAFAKARKKQGRYGEFAFRGKKYHTQYDYEKGVKESFEIDPFDVIFEHLLIEGYAETSNEALEIMETMTQDEIQGVLDFYYS